MRLQRFVSGVLAAASLAVLTPGPPIEARQAAVALWDPATLSRPEHAVRMHHHVRVPMRDGVALSADLYLPEAAGGHPALLWRTPYSNNTAPTVAQSRWFAERGYAVVVQDVRGKYDSGGEAHTFAHEASDGHDTVEWIARQPWSNGKVGTMGGSYLGYTQIALGLGGSTHLTAMAASVTTSDLYNNWVYVDGALFFGFAFPWGAVAMDGHTQQYTAAYDWPAVFPHLPVATADAAASRVNAPYREWVRHPTRDDTYWDAISYERRVHEIGVPFLVVDGWYDIFLRGALRDDVAIRTRAASAAVRRGKRLVIGPWAHGTGVRRINAPTPGDRGIDFGPAAELELRNLYLRWHDHWLKGMANGVPDDPPVTLFVMGENVWRHEREWPLARTVYTRYYLDSGGRANSAAGDGTLATTLPRGAEADRFTYDPETPVPTAGGNTCCSVVPSGPWDQRAVEARDDVLVYSTPPLTEALEITGPIQMTLHAATSARDTDWTAKLVDVHPDGYAQNIQDGILRARYRDGIGQAGTLVEPGRVYVYTIDLWATSHVFLPGHRLRLEVSSSNFPRFDRNLNTGEDPATGIRMAPAEQAVYHSAARPSALILPVIPRPATTAAPGRR